VTGRRLIVLRHGQTSWNESGRAQGHADLPLDVHGHAQAAAVAPYLASLRPVALWSSDLARARQTCVYLELETGLSAKYDERLREFDVGARQGLTITDFSERFPEEYAAWARGEATHPVPGAEVAPEVQARMLPALRECLSSMGPGETGVVVTHGAALKVGVVALLDWPAELAAGIRVIDNCAWVTLEELRANGRLRMLGYNERVRVGNDVSGAR